MTDVDISKSTMTTARSKQALRSSAAASWGSIVKPITSRDKLIVMQSRQTTTKPFQASKISSASNTGLQVSPLQEHTLLYRSASSPSLPLRNRPTQASLSLDHHPTNTRSVVLDASRERPKTVIGGRKMQQTPLATSTLPAEEPPVPAADALRTSTCDNSYAYNAIDHLNDPLPPPQLPALRRAKSSMDILDRELRAIHHQTPTRCRKDPPRGSMQFESLMYEFQKMDDAEIAESEDTVHDTLLPSHHQRLQSPTASRPGDSRIRRRLSWNPEISVQQIARSSETD